MIGALNKSLLTVLYPISKLIMQKIVNIIALASGVVSIALVSSGVFVYVNRDSIVDSIKQQAIDAALGSLGPSIPTLPSQTGPVLMDAPAADAPSSPMAGLGIPN
tara:strand:- start:225 stop:539 length:315 start_codon:yes stop_codon:yes gene_type:complete